MISFKIINIYEIIKILNFKNKKIKIGDIYD